MKRGEIKKLDLLWSKVVRMPKECAYCGRTERMGYTMNAAHIVGRRHRATRWGAVIDGKFDTCGMCLCFNCHNQYDEHGYLEIDIRIAIGLVRIAKIQEYARNNLGKDIDFEDRYKLLKNIEKVLGDQNS